MSVTSTAHLRGCTLPLSALLVICTIALSLFTSAVDARPSSLTSHSQSSHHSYDDLKDLLRTRRTPGFKQGAIDRVGHGFGKRSTDLDELLAPPEPEEEPAEFAMTNEYLAKALTRNPELTLTFVRQYIDHNSDGLVTPDELQTFFISD